MSAPGAARTALYEASLVVKGGPSGGGVVGRLTQVSAGPRGSHRGLASAARARHQRREQERQRRTLTVTHLHELRDPAGKDDSPERRRQAQLLVSLIAGTSESGDLVVCGDLNLLPGSETFRALGEIGLVDLVGTADTRTSRYTGSVRHANYMLVSEPESVQGFEVEKTPEISDHRPLVLDI